MYESLRPLMSTLLAMIFSFIWVIYSPHNILELDPRCMFYLTGTVFSNICCRLIIAQMSGTRCELLSFILCPLLMAVVFVFSVPGITAKTELRVLYGLSTFVTLAHIHYGTCVVIEMCNHFNIRPFHIKPYSPINDPEVKERLVDHVEDPNSTISVLAVEKKDN